MKKITGNQNVDRPLQRIREFRNRPNPKIVVTVDMLSTDVDIPGLEFIVFLRPVKSRILWEQMLGRGTRRCDEINKTKFVVFDCFDGTLLRYFRDVSNFQIEEPRADPLSIPELIENIWQNIDRDYHVRLLVKRLRRIEKDMSGDAREQFTRWMPDGDVGRFAGELTARLRDNFTDTMRLLRTPAFQQLLTDYPRAKRQFIIAHEAQDTVSSQLVERYGPFPSAEDYLGAFSAFVRNKAHEIEALRILISKPEGWNPDALVTLRRQLNENGYDEKTLRRAHERVHRKALADLISMIKHAAREAEPLLTAVERVAAALAENPRLPHVHTRAIAVVRSHRPSSRRESLHRHRKPQHPARLHQARRPRPRPPRLRRSAPAAHRAAQLHAGGVNAFASQTAFANAQRP